MFLNTFCVCVKIMIFMLSLLIFCAKCIVYVYYFEVVVFSRSTLMKHSRPTVYLVYCFEWLLSDESTFKWFETFDSNLPLVIYDNNKYIFLLTFWAWFPLMMELMVGFKVHITLFFKPTF